MSPRLDLIRLAQLAERHDDVFTVADTKASGMPAGCLRRLEAAGEIVRLSKSAFVRAAVWHDAQRWDRFRLQSIAFGRTAAAHVFLTGASAQVLHRLPTFAAPPPLPVAIRIRPTSSGTNLSRHAHVRTGFLPTAHQWNTDGVGLVSSAYCAIDVARHSSPEEALAVVDHVLRDGVPRERLAKLLDDLQRYPGIEQARWAVEHGDGRAESPNETLGRLAFIEAGLRPPLSNVWIFDDTTAFRVDHLLEQDGVILEADGALKLNNRADAHQQMRGQVLRESWLRSKGFGLERYDMPMAQHQRSRILRLADRATRSQRGRPVPTCWSLERPAWLWAS